MKSTLLVFSFLFVPLHAAVVNRNLSQILDTPTDTPPCSTNTSSAYVDIILMIDTSANMGTANLRKISTTLSLVFSKFTIGQQVDITQGFRNTRIGVVAYNSQATIAAKYTDINSTNDLANVLNALSASNSSDVYFYDGLVNALHLLTNCSDSYECSLSNIYNYTRPTAIIVFAAAVESDNIDSINLFETARSHEVTIITVNFNTANHDLTIFLDIVTFNNYIHATMYNFISTNNTLTRDLEWAILQANCYTGDFNALQAIYYDQANSRYSRYAEYFFLVDFEKANDTIEMCDIGPYTTIPAFVLTKQKENFVQNIIAREYPLYFGLHQNNQSQWSFYNYDRTEFPISSYTNWAPGYPNGSDRCAVLDSNDGFTSVWKSYGCPKSGLGKMVCQGKACDASSVACCSNCISNGVSYEKKQKIRTKYRNIMPRKLANGKPVRTA